MPPLARPGVSARAGSAARAAASAAGGLALTAAALPTPAGQRAPTLTALRQQASLLAALTRCIALVGLAAAAFGPAYAYVALALVYGPRWATSGAPAALGAYACYVPLLALNGTLEAFVHSVASEVQLRRINAWLVAFAAAHVALALVGLRSAGALGLIAADAAGMTLRIAYALRFAAAHFAPVPGYSLRQLSPRPRTLAAYATAAALTCASRLALLPESAAAVGALRRTGLLPAPLAALAEAVGSTPLLPRMAAHVGVGAACLAALAGALYAWEREVVARLRQLRKGSKEG